MLYWIPRVLHLYLLGYCIRLWKLGLILVHSLESHLLLHECHLRLLRVQKLLLLVCLALPSVVDSFQLGSAVGLIG